MEQRRGAKRATSKGAGRSQSGLTAGRHVLYYGDNLDVLRDHRRIKDESVDLCYMDPPFNSKRNYNQIYRNIGEDRAQAQAFIDTWKWDDHARVAHRQILANEDGRYPPALVALVRGLHGVLGEGSLFAYLVGMSVRISEIRRALKPTGSFYFHCDPTASHYLKLISDAVFCSQGGDFISELIWKRSSAHGGTRGWGPIHDTLLMYSRSEQYIWTPQLSPEGDESIAKWYVHEDKRGRYKRGDLTGAGTRSGASGDPWRGFNPTEKGRHWAVPREILKKVTGSDEVRSPQASLDLLFDAERIIWPKKKGGQPMLKRYLHEAKGVSAGDVITDIPPLSLSTTERLGYPTQKPLALLERIINASCPEDGVVFDPCCGCGTTIAAAEKLGRRWMGIDITYQSISLVLQRLEDQVGPEKWPALDLQINLTGIPRDMESARALANKRDDRVRKEFEKWAVLTYTNNRGAINEKKGADAGIDGRVYFVTGPTENATMVIQVKSGAVGRSDISKLRGDMEREKAAMATLITLEEPTAPMISEAKGVGLYHHDLMDRDYDKIRIVTVKQIIEEGARLELPLTKDLTKIAPQLKNSGENLSLFEQTSERKGPRAAENAAIVVPAEKTSASKLRRTTR